MDESELRPVVERLCDALSTFKDHPMRFILLDQLVLLAFYEDEKLQKTVPFGFPEDLRIIVNPVFLIASQYPEVLEELKAHPADTIDTTIQIMNGLA